MGVAGFAGLFSGGALWALSGGQAQGEALEALDARLAGVSTRSRAPLDRPSDALAQIVATPIFVASAQVAPTDTDVQVQVFGLARSPVRTAALFSVGGAPAEWLSVGESRGGVTLRSVSSSSAVVATIFGEREIMLGMPSQTAGSPGTPAGFRSPPPPASAPGMPQ